MGFKATLVLPHDSAEDLGFDIQMAVTYPA
jgi:hypothetical protein